MYKDENGNIIPQFIKYENLQNELLNLMDEWGIENVPTLQHYKKGITSLNLDIKSIFNKQQLVKINRMFEEEFEYFGYEMIT